MRTLLIIITTTFILFVSPLVWVMQDSKADEALFITDADHYELELTVNEQEFVDKAIWKYEWDEKYQGTTTIKTTMQATVPLNGSN